MGHSGSHRGLELRLETLAARLRMLREKVDRAEGLAKIEGHREIAQLERRQKDLEQRLSALKREAPGFKHEMKNELEKLAFDLSGAVEDFILWTDSGFQPGKWPACAVKPWK
jgi:predicted RNase H-like nuclease (RuvC/YqgF family)